jgi:hypothetical protein
MTDVTKEWLLGQGFEAVLNKQNKYIWNKSNTFSNSWFDIEIDLIDKTLMHYSCPFCGNDYKGEDYYPVEFLLTKQNIINLIQIRKLTLSLTTKE